MPYNWKKHYALKQRFATEFNWLTEQPGIYILTREEGNITYFYVGQAKNIKNRRFDYYKIQCGLSYPTRHFEASLKKHKDWEFKVLETCTIEELDAREKYWIDYYNALPNHITRNDLLAGKDIVRSNAKRIHTVYTRYENDIKKMLKQLYCSYNDSVSTLTICPKSNKNHTFTKRGQKEIINLWNWLKGLIENGKDN